MITFRAASGVLGEAAPVRRPAKADRVSGERCGGGHLAVSLVAPRAHSSGALERPPATGTEEALDPGRRCG